MTRMGVKCSLFIPALPRRSAPSGGVMFRLVAGQKNFNHWGERESFQICCCLFGRCCSLWM